MNLPSCPLPALPRWRRALHWICRSVWLGFVPVLAGCTGLPAQVQRPVSTAQLPAPDAPLVRWMTAQRNAAGTRHLSGFALLSGPQAAYGSRLAMVQEARHTLDLQYYAIHADESTERLLTGIVAAARRGVRVRVLLDDFHSAGQNAQVMRLAFEPGIEMRMFNPVAGIRGSKMGRMVSALADFSRAQQRMHNKLFIADNVAAVTGGRNLGDAYFGHGDSGNFVDLDVLAIGPVVRQLSATFDWYWNDERAYPVQSLIRPEDLDRWRGAPPAPHPAAEAAQTPAPVLAAQAASMPHGQTLGVAAAPADDAAARERRARVWDHKPLDLGSLRYVWAPAAVLVDQPAKIPADPPGAGASAAAAPSASRASGTAAPSPAAAIAASAAHVAPGTAAARPATAASLPAVYDPADPPPEDPAGETVVDGLLALMRQARRDLTIISPYFVPGREMMEAFAHARARGVRVRVLTNSLASNDAPIAHAGYARYRPALLDRGVELYEMRSEQRGLRSALGSGSGGAAGASRAMLHSKILVVDERLVVIGSMNLDMRSHLQNTEIALLIRSGTLGRVTTAQIVQAMEHSAWRVERGEGQALAWRAPQGSGLADTRTEPDASLPLRMLLRVLGPLAPEHLL